MCGSYNLTLEFIENMNINIVHVQNCSMYRYIVAECMYVTYDTIIQYCDVYFNVHNNV